LFNSNKSFRKTDSRACNTERLYRGIATASKIPMMIMTIIISSNVNPELRTAFLFLTTFPVLLKQFFFNRLALPILVLGVIKGGALGLGVNVVHTLPAP
jgi:hypothetical protein